MNKMFVSNDLNYFHNASMRCGSSQKIGFSWRFTEHFAAVLSARRVSTQLLGVQLKLKMQMKVALHYY